MKTAINSRFAWLRAGLLPFLLFALAACNSRVARQTATVTPAATPSPACVFSLRLEGDLTDPPLVAPGALLPYSWRLRNNGDCDWPAGSQIVHESGASFGVPLSLPVGIVPAGTAITVPVSLTAPQTPGTVTGLWRLVDGQGAAIGEQLPITLRVAAATPTDGPSPQPGTSTVTPSPVPPPTGTSPPVPEPTGTPPTTPSAMPPPTATPSAAPVVASFSANVTIADPGDAILLSWTTTHAGAATLYYLMPTGQFGDFWAVEPNGSFTYDTHEWQRNGVTFMIFAYDQSGAHASASLTIPLRCTGDWFFANPPDICPFDPPLASAAAEQRFEHGTMLWLGAQDRIVVLYDDDQGYAYDNFSDEWDPGEPESDPGLVPPPGLQQPVRGFGLVWREANDGRVGERLGWAVAAEAGYETLIQTTSYAKYNHTFILARDGLVWHLFAERSDWEKIPR